MATFYLSSTYEDLKDCRLRVSKALRDMGHHVVGMENYTANGAAPLETCLKDGAKCDVYVGIFAWRYGHIPVDGNPRRKSITELEYRKAVAEKKGILVFVLEASAPWSPTFIDTGDKKKRLKSLRDSVAEKHSIGTFENCGDLTEKVMAAVGRLILNDRPLAAVSPIDVQEVAPAVEPRRQFWKTHPRLIVLTAAALFLVLAGLMAHQIYLSYWPKRWGNSWSDAFTNAKKLDERWNYPKGSWATEPGESVADIKDDEALLVKGQEMGIPNDLGQRVFYNFTANFKVRFKKGATRAAWVLRAQRDRESGYLFEVAQEGGHLVLSGWIYEHKQKVESLGGYPLPFTGLTEKQGLYMDVKVEGNNIDYRITFEDDEPDDTSPIGQYVDLHFQDDPSHVRWPWGSFGFLETDNTSVMRVEYLYIYPLL